jgi:hypothetical protein
VPALVYAYPEAEGAVRAWVRALNISGLAARAFFGIPVKGAVFPLVVLARVGGRPVRGVPIDRPLIQFDIMGETPVDRRPPSDKFALGVIAEALAGAADSIASGTVIASGVVCLGAEVENGPVWSPSPVDGRSRYTLDVSFLLRAQ